MTTSPPRRQPCEVPSARPTHDLEHVGAIVRRWMTEHVIDGRGAEPQCPQCGGRVVESTCADCATEVR